MYSRQLSKWKYIFVEVDGPSSIEANDVVILILGPDSPSECAFAALLRSDIKNERTHFTEKLTAHKLEVVHRAIKTPVDDKHLGKTTGQVFHGIELAEFAEKVSGNAVLFKQRLLFFFGFEVEFPEEISIAGRAKRQLVVFIEVLQICFDQRMQRAHFVGQHGLASDDPIDDRVHRSGAGGCIVRVGLRWVGLVLLWSLSRENQSGKGQQDRQERG
jgi:hypothetical protein